MGAGRAVLMIANAKQSKLIKLIFKEDLQKAIKEALHAIHVLENYLEDIEGRE